MLDQLDGWRSYARLHAKEQDPRRKAMIANMMDHYKWEVLGEPDRLLEGVHPDAHYKFYGLPDGILEYRGHDEIRGFYQGLVESGANVLNMDMHYMLVSDDAIAAHGVWHQVYRGSDLLAEGGLVASADIDDPDGRYLISQPQGFFLPFGDGDDPLLLGEIVYLNSEPLAIRKLAEGEEVFNQVSEEDFVFQPG